VLATKPKGDLLTFLIDATKDEVTYSASQLRQQTRESRLFREEVREIARVSVYSLQPQTVSLARGWATLVP
jgi:hypothetical protein